MESCARTDWGRIAGYTKKIAAPPLSRNDEANLNVYDADFARRQSQVFDEDLRRSRRVTYEEWENRAWQGKMIEHAAGLLSSQL
jgi:hypothetical protein